MKNNKIIVVAGILLSMGILAFPIYGEDHTIEAPICGCRDQGTFIKLQAINLGKYTDPDFLLAEFINGGCVRFSPGQSVRVLDFGTTKIDEETFVLIKVRYRGMSEYWTDARAVFDDK
jgi:hypothetical protein